MLKIRESINRRVLAYDNAIRKSSSEAGRLIFLREKRRWLCRNDLFYLCGLTGNHKVVAHAGIYRSFCDEVSLMNWLVVRLGIFSPSEDMLRVEEVTDCPEEDFKKERLYLFYRAFFKTTIITKVHTLQLLLNFPNARVVILHNKQDNASDNLMTVRNFFLSSYVGQVFPEYVPKTKEWGNLGGFSVLCKTDIARSEDSVEAIGVGTEITGRHWDIAKKDDIVTEDSVNTEEQVKKTSDYDDRFNIGHFTDAKFKIQDYSGTRYHFADRYSVLKNNPAIKVMECAICDDNGVPTHPEKYTIEDIETMRRSVTPWVWNCQMKLNPEDPSKMSFKKEMIQYYDAVPRECVFYLVVDPASKRKKRSDYTAMMVVGIDSTGKRYIVDIIRDKIDPKNRIDAGIDLAIKWNIKECGWEEVGLGDDNFYLEEKRREKQRFFIVTPIKTQKVAKEDRIRNILMPEYAEHRWLWPRKGTMIKYSSFDGRNHDLTESLEKEFLEFPLSEHDDLLDVQSFLTQLTIIKPPPQNAEIRKPMTFGDYHKIIEETRRENGKGKWRPLSNVSRV